MSKPNIKKLKYPVWFNIIFSVLTLGIPLALFVYSGFSSAESKTATVFKITFGAILILAIAWWFIYKFVIKRYIDKIVAKQAALEHDYSIETGNPTAIKALWFTNEKILTILDGVRVLLYGGLSAVLLMGIEAGLVKARVILLIIACCYVIAYTIKMILLMSQKEESDEGTGTGQEVSKVDSSETNS